MIPSAQVFRKFSRSRVRSAVGLLSFIQLFLLFPEAVLSQSVPFPRTGFYNGYLNQSNILECDNGNDAAVSLELGLRRLDGSALANVSFAISAFGSRHIILEQLAAISDTYGSYTLNLLSSSPLGDRISCRTAFYRFAAMGSPKLLEFAYALPVRGPLTGDAAGLFNSFNPYGTTPTFNWLSVINLGISPFSASLDIYSYEGNLERTLSIPALAPYERRDIGLGHPDGQRTGVYRIRPANSNQPFESFLVRYGSNGSSFDFAFPIRALPGSCSDTPLQISTMGNGLTQNWLELFNPRPVPGTVLVSLRNRNGTLLHEESASLPPFGQKHIFVNPHLDPQGTGNVGSASVLCLDPSAAVVAQSAFYGRIPGPPKVEWAYAVQSGTQFGAGAAEQLTVPVNTYLGMANWFKAANSGLAALQLNYTMLNQAGNALNAETQTLFAGGTADIGLHQTSGYSFIGSLLASPGSGEISGEVLRVLPRAGGEIGTIMHIPALVQPKSSWPEPPEGLFPSGSVWYQDISAAPLDAQSAQVIEWLENAGGWGTGILRIDYSIEVLNAASDTPLRSFQRTDDFYDPDCDYEQVPVPLGGALEGESGYQCESDGDCHLIVVHRPSGKLFEMWRANIVGGSGGSGGTFFGGCLAVWDMNRIYGPSGRGENCTSADAAGYPIAPLLFTADEVASGEIRHAIRFILPNARIRNGVYLHPSTHSTSAASGGPNAPPYGTRLRLRADFPLSSLPNEAARVVARAMQRYGILLSDGGSIALTAQSDRFTAAKWDGLLDTRDLQSIHVSDFQMVDGGARIPYTGDCVRNP